MKNNTVFLKLLLFSWVLGPFSSVFAQNDLPERREDRLFSTHNVICEDYGCNDKSTKTKLDIQLGDSETYVLGHLKTLNIEKTEDQSGNTDRGAFRIFKFRYGNLGNVEMLFWKGILVYFSLPSAPHYSSNAIDVTALTQNNKVNIIYDGDDLFSCFCGSNYVLAFEGTYAVLFHRGHEIREPHYHFFYIETVQRWIGWGVKYDYIFDSLISDIRCVRNKKAADIFITLTSCGG